MAWVALIPVALEAIKNGVAIYKDLNDSVSNEDIAAQLRALSEQIERVRREILAAIDALEERELTGEVDGMLQILGTYDPVEGDDERLRTIIDDGVIVLGRLRKALDAKPALTDPRRYFSLFDAFVLLIVIRAIAMSERERRFKNPERKDIPAMFQWTTPQIETGLDTLKTLVNRRIEGPVWERRGDTVEYGYELDGRFIEVASYLDEPIERGAHQNPYPAREQARKATERKREELWLADERRQFLEYLRGAFNIDVVTLLKATSPTS